jgi:hypothetical protein
MPLAGIGVKADKACFSVHLCCAILDLVLNQVSTQGQLPDHPSGDPPDNSIA